MNVYYLVGLYLAISAVITQRSQRIFLFVSFSDSDSACVASFDDRASVDTSGFCIGFSSVFSVPCAICTSTTRLRRLWKVTSLIVIQLWTVKTATASMNDCYTKYLPPTANSRCSKLTTTQELFILAARVSLPLPRQWWKGRTRRTLQMRTFSRTQCSFEGLETALQC